MLPLGLPALDALLGGGLQRAALHEIRSETTPESGAQTGFAVALLARLAAADPRPVLWVEEETALHEAGHPYGPGLAAFGIDPGRLILIAARRADEALWVLEEGLRCPGLAAAVGVLRGHPRALDLTGHRRLALRARAHGVTGLLLRQAGSAEPGASLTRWRVGVRPAGTIDGYAAGVGRPAFRLDLEKNRLGPTGSFDVEWDHESRRFAPLAGGSTVHGPGASDAGAVAPLSLHRPAASDSPRQGLAVRAAG
jgi:protein ImuA